MFLTYARRVLGIVALPVVATSCTSSLDLDRFHTGAASSVDTAIAVTYFDIRFGARGMTSHLAEYFEVRLVDRDNRIQARAVYDNITSPDFTLYLGRVVPKAKAPYRLDFWADHNNSGKYDGIEGGINDKDHAWRRVMSDPLPDDMRLVAGRYELDFVHDTDFVDIDTDLAGNKIVTTDTLLPFNLKVTGTDAFLGTTIEVRVADKTSTRLVGFHRQGKPLPAYTAKILGILDDKTPYTVSVYADVNADGKYDAGDPSWLLDLVSDSQGLAGELDLGTAPQTPIQTGEP